MICHVEAWDWSEDMQDGTTTIVCSSIMWCSQQAHALCSKPWGLSTHKALKSYFKRCHCAQWATVPRTGLKSIFLATPSMPIMLIAWSMPPPATPTYLRHAG